MAKITAPSLEHLSIPKEEYTSIRAYNISKLCSILAMHYLGYRWLNTEKTVFCAHPGSFIKTRLCRNWWVYEALYTTMLPFSKTIVSLNVFLFTSKLFIIKCDFDVYCMSSGKRRARSCTARRLQS